MAEQRIQGRKMRIQKLREMIRENPEEPRKKVLARFCVVYGVTEYTAGKYLKLLERADAIPKEKTGEI